MIPPATGTGGVAVAATVALPEAVLMQRGYEVSRGANSPADDSPVKLKP